MMEELKGCLVCGAEDSLRKKFLLLTDHSLTGDRFSISKCDSCEALLTDPRPNPSEIGKYYDFPEYISHRDDAPGLINRIYQLARRWTTRQKTALMNEVSDPSTGDRSILDYGCGTGYFLQTAKEAGWRVEGVELNLQARTAASERIGQEIASEIDELPAARSYKVITLWHVLEHVHTLSETVEKLLDRLAENGTMLVAVPNPLSLDAETYGEWWAAYDVPRHLYHFTPRSIALLAERHQAQVVRRIGQPLDSFYISLLSEKYKKGSQLRGWLRGLESCVSAWKSNNYSSIIYVIKKNKGS